MATVSKLLTAEDYAELPTSERPTELIRGEIVELNQPQRKHGRVCSKIDRRIGEFVERHELGRSFCNDVGLVTQRGPDTVRGIDFCFVSYARWPKGNDDQDGYLPAAPDLAVEVLSPSDRRSEWIEKVEEYLASGVLVVCIVNPGAKTAELHRRDRPVETFAGDDALVLDDVLPGFRLSLNDLFA